ncbi:MAG: T9SS type A sorting domain-containing protein [Candidatus Cloacimonetes bacterium]|nr:T9SS type A sorting domain-containing protein [Candidatus Cloacimonadota bacterium]MBS3766665.1 T9SS type A sorting domain-containing protein [Candidatus Cloacimonadota bacterium]
MKKPVLLTIMITLIFITSINALEISLNYDINKIKFREIRNYDYIEYGDLTNTIQTGAPSLPRDASKLSIPPGKEIAKIKITNTESTFLDKAFNIYPAQPPTVLSKKESEVNFVQPVDKYYKSKNLFPENIVEKGKRGYLSGYNIASLLIHPFQYDPAIRQVKFYSKITVNISLRNVVDQTAKITKRSKLAEDYLTNKVRKLVDNPQDLRSYNYNVNSNKSNKLPDEEYLYVIITSEDLVPEFGDLANWKNKKGFSAELVTAEWIYDEYSGVDNAAKIRNFIKDAYQNWGTLWVLLGGDTQVIPDRKAFAFDCEYGDYEDNYLPCDLYYSDLDGSWNENGNDIYGEVEDDIDMYPDVFVGRAPVENSSEASAFVDKVITYEKNPPEDYAKEMLYLAMVLWWDPYTDSGIGKDLIDSLYVPPRFDPIEKLYQSQGNETYENVMTALNNGKNFVNHDGHAWWNVMGIGDGHLTNNDMDILTNGPKYSVLYSIGCWPAAFDYDCIAEHFLTNPDGGGVAFVGNSRYGWGSPGNPVYGYSDRFDQEFYHQIFDKGINTIGNTVGAIKSTYIPFSGQENVFRWCEYEINLLGDPTLPIWTDEPRELTVNYPDTIPLGNNQCNITVNHDAQPVENALVCLMAQQQGIYVTGYTGINGQLSLPIEVTDPSKDISITVTGKNFIPVEGAIKVDTDQTYIQISDFSLNGSISNLIEPGDTALVDITVKNFGSNPVSNLNLTLETTSDKVTFLDSLESIATIASNDSVQLAGAFEFIGSNEIKNEETIYLNYQISSAEEIWDGVLGIVGAEAKISYYTHEISDSMGNDNGIAEPGEFVNPNLILQNKGLISADDVTVTLSTDSPYLSIPYCAWSFDKITPEDYSAEYLEVGIDSNCPTPLFPILYLHIYKNGTTTIDSFILAVGEIGFEDDMESGTDNWTHSGENDLWHQTYFKSMSGDYSWYCGDSLTHRYVNNMNASLISEDIVLDENSVLSFWCWYDFPNYGTDGMYVEVKEGNEWETLDFIGSGGALGTLTTGNDWLPYEYNLSQYPAGTEVKIRFRMFSNEGEIGKGTYIDDVTVTKENNVITPNFYADVLFGDKPLQVQFFDETTSISDSIASWYWQFGDGETSTEQSPSHIYNVIGKKTVKLTVTDEFGFTASRPKYNYIDVASGGGNVVYIAADGSGDYTNLYQGINHVYDGDTLLIADGTYGGSMNKNLDLEGKNVYITSENGNEDCILDGDNAGFAFALKNSESTVINGLTFKNFYNPTDGGTIYGENSSLHLENCVFDSCSAAGNGGAIYIDGGENLGFKNNQFTALEASYGGALAVGGVDSTWVINNSFGSNIAQKGAAIYLNNNTNIIIDSSDFVSNESGSMGGALFSKNCVNLVINHSEFNDNIAENGAAAYFNADSAAFQVTVDNSIFENNSASQYGGGIYSLSQAGLIKNSVFHGNNSIRGGGVALEGSSDFETENCLFIGNSVIGNTGFGGGFYVYDSDCSIKNCTFSKNYAQNYGSGAMVYSGTLNIHNSILWADSIAPEITKLNSDVEVSYSNVEDGYQGTGNINLNPLFEDPDQINYELTSASPCIDAGWNSYVNSDTDLAGNERIWDGDDDGEPIVDMGCYEYGAPPFIVDEPQPDEPVLLSVKNYPNPFTVQETMNIEFALAQPQNIEISVYNILGQKVKNITEKYFSQGNYTVKWNGKNKDAQKVSSGIYFYKIKTDNSSFVRKMLLIR